MSEGPETDVDSLVTGLVREFLYRRGLTAILQTFDAETGYSHGDALSSTRELVEALRLSTLYKRNASSDAPLPSVLEVLTAHIYRRARPPDSDAPPVVGIPAEDATPLGGRHAADVPDSAAAARVDTGPAAFGDAPPEEVSDVAQSVSAISTPSLIDSPHAANETSAPESSSDAVVSAGALSDAPVGTGTNDTLDGATGETVSSSDCESLPVPSTVPSLMLPLVSSVSDALEPVVPGASATVAAAAAVKEEIPAQPPAPPSAMGAFEARLAAAKAARSAAQVAPSVPAPPPPAPPVPAAGNQFEARLAASRAAAASAPLQSSAPAPSIPELAPAAAPSLNSFEARLAAMKASAAAAPPALPASSTLPQQPAAPASSFEARLAAKKAAEAASVAAPQNAPDAAAAPMSFAARLAASKAMAPVAAATAAFTAPDGRGFSDRAEYRRYMFETFYLWRGERGNPGGSKRVLTKVPGSVAGQPFCIEDCADVELRLLDWSETVQVDRVSRSRIFIAASCESVFLRNLDDCVVTVACKQLRMRDCRNVTVYLYAKTDPIVEASGGIVFAPFNGACAGLRAAFSSASLDPRYNHWARVFDFSKDDTSLPSPHWALQGE